MHFYEPVAVDQIERSRWSDVLRRVTIPMTFGVIAWASPPPNTTWDILTMQLELSCTANVGTRGVYQYFMDEETQTMRFEAFHSAAGFINKCVCQEGMGGSTVASAAERTFTAPLYLSVIDPPSRIGCLLADFDGGDTAQYHLLVRERSKL